MRYDKAGRPAFAAKVDGTHIATSLDLPPDRYEACLRVPMHPKTLGGCACRGRTRNTLIVTEVADDLSWRADGVPWWRIVGYVSGPLSGSSTWPPTESFGKSDWCARSLACVLRSVGLRDLTSWPAAGMRCGWGSGARCGALEVMRPPWKCSAVSLPATPRHRPRVTSRWRRSRTQTRSPIRRAKNRRQAAGNAETVAFVLSAEQRHAPGRATASWRQTTTPPRTAATAPHPQASPPSKTTRRRPTPAGTVLGQRKPSQPTCMSAVPGACAPANIGPGWTPVGCAAAGECGCGLGVWIWSAE